MRGTFIRKGSNRHQYHSLYGCEEISDWSAASHSHCGARSGRSGCSLNPQYRRTLLHPEHQSVSAEAPDTDDSPGYSASLSPKESLFENCVADVNIPVGEVFTSPVLKGPLPECTGSGFLPPANGIPPTVYFAPHSVLRLPF